VELLSLDIQSLTTNLIKLTAAFLLTIPVAWDREVESRSMGLRTFPLVVIASCAFILIAGAVIGIDDDNAQARLIQGLMTGVGFIGGGAILKDNGTVRGAAVAYGRLEIGIIVSLLTFLLLRGLGPVKSRIQEMNDDENL
jgi:putative Mg2+ transporter-C (MgtC) family protein